MFQAHQPPLFVPEVPASSIAKQSTDRSIPLPYAGEYLKRKPLGKVPSTAVRVICRRLKAPADVIALYDRQDCGRAATELATFARVVTDDQQREVLALLARHLHEPARLAAPFTGA